MRRTISPEVWNQAKTAHASGIRLRELARNMKLPEGTVLARAKREGWTQQIQTAKSAAQSPILTAITPMESAAVTMQQRADRHVGRMAGVTERVVDYIETMQPAVVLDSIHEVEKLDRVARRTFGLSDGQQTGGMLSVAILTNQAVVSIR